MNKPVEAKKKTGDIEHLRMIWAAFIALTMDLEHGAQEKARDAFVGGLLDDLDNHLLPDMDGFLDDVNGRVPAFAAKMLSNKRKQRPAVDDLVGKLEAIHKFVSGKANQDIALQFLINLILFDYRTADGGRIRKSTSVLRQGSDEYARPFESKLPHYAEYLLKAMPGLVASSATASSSSATVNIKVSQKSMYIPPTRFTASFPLHLQGVQKAEGPLDNPTLPKSKDSTAKSDIRYKFLPSFGFSEPGYCTWDSGDSSEYDGTRLSIGAYSLSPSYLGNLRGLHGRMDPTTRKHYQQYGGVGSTHLDALGTLFSAQTKNGWQRGPDLAIAWVAQLVQIARQLNLTAVGKFPALKNFFVFILRKIEIRRNKLEVIRTYPTSKFAKSNGSAGVDKNLFDRIWVIESSLWEFALLAASCLSCAEIAASIAKLNLAGSSAPWQSSVSTNSGLQDRVSINGSAAFDRYYFSSGTAAADALYEHLKALGIAPYTIKADRKKLSTYTPYFEFYQPSTSILNPANNQVPKSKPRGYQVWLNLSEGLHSELLRIENTKVGLHLAERIAEYIIETEKLAERGIAPMYLVIDYTKFAGDTPNAFLYPILAQLATWLASFLGDKQISGITFLRSNLKYNTGTIDRYQSGELLVVQDSSLNINNGLLARTQASFTARERANEWQLRGAYIPLMKKLYVLSDAVAYLRWGVYAGLWGAGKGVHSLSTAVPAPLHKDIVTIQRNLINICGGKFDILFQNMAASCSGKKKEIALSKDAVAKIKHLKRRVSEDIEYLKSVSSRTSPELEHRVRKMLGYLKMIDEIIVAMNAATPPQDKHKRGIFHSYRSRLKNFAEDIAVERDRLSKISTPSEQTSWLHSNKATGKVWGTAKLKEDRHWYTDDEINTILNLRLGGHEHVYTMGGIDAHLHDGFTFMDNLREARNAIIGTTMNVIVVPLNINGNHWTALYLRFDPNGDVGRQRPTIRYVDPLRHSGNPPEWLRLIIRLLFGNSNIATSSSRYQFDGYNCGPLTVMLLEYMALHNGNLPAGPINADQRRAEDSQLLREHNPMYCEQCHKRRTERTST
ncbi:MAG: hypothetical protein AAGC55_06700, partial [Myxococcota bacterium]